MNILVTGGAGYIGSHTVIELLKANHDVTIIDNLSTSTESYVERIKDLAKEVAHKEPTFIKGDIKNTKDLTKLFKSDKFDAVVHFAAYKNVYESMEQPDVYYTNNVAGTINLLNHMIEYNVKQIVFSSSCSVYGQPKKLPVDEKHLLDPLSPYARTKAIIEMVLQDYSELGLKSVSLRYFNAAGAHPSGKIGEYPAKLLNIIPRIFGAALGKYELKLFGNEFDTRDGSQIRDYIHVMDLASAHKKSLDYLSRIKDNHTALSINVGTGKGTTVLELFDAVEKTTGKKVPYEVIAPKGGDPVVVYGDNTLAQKMLDWKPKYGTKEIIDHSWEWYQQVLDEWK